MHPNGVARQVKPFSSAASLSRPRPEVPQLRLSAMHITYMVAEMSFCLDTVPSRSSTSFPCYDTGYT